MTQYYDLIPPYNPIPYNPIPFNPLLPQAPPQIPQTVHTIPLGTY